ncbi:MAG: YkgJ family cysteine cluster protein [Candidatus Woesearchaeota archaeon]|jgi:Fe-S-cluster containining protein
MVDAIKTKKRFACDQVSGKCILCGDCCRRYSMTMHPEDERILKEKMYASKGIIYLYPFSMFGLPFKPDEVEKFKKIAKKKKVECVFKPLKMIIKNGKPVVIDYFLDMDSCPFLIENNCTNYEDRFSVCRAFPEVTKFSNSFDFDYDKDLSYSDALKIAKNLK